MLRKFTAVAVAMGLLLLVPAGCKSNSIDATFKQCEGKFQDCDRDQANGCEINTELDVRNCGACARQCPSQNGVASCSNSACSLACSAGFADCDADPSNGCETNLTLDGNCGACGVQCVLDNTAGSCVAGACEFDCRPGFGDCNKDTADGCELSLNTVENCGACGKVCKKVGTKSRCADGKCEDTGCSTGYHECSGTCARDDSPSTCGNLCTPCPSGAANTEPYCTNDQKCATRCASGYTDCGGTCRRLADDANNCGACGTSCDGGSCAGGTCAPLVLATGVVGAQDITIGDNYIFFRKTGSNSVIWRLARNTPGNAEPFLTDPAFFRLLKASGAWLSYERTYPSDIYVVPDAALDPLPQPRSPQGKPVNGSWTAYGGRLFWMSVPAGTWTCTTLAGQTLNCTEPSKPANGCNAQCSNGAGVRLMSVNFDGTDETVVLDGIAPNSQMVWGFTTVGTGLSWSTALSNGVSGWYGPGTNAEIYVAGGGNGKIATAFNKDYAFYSTDVSTQPAYRRRLLPGSVAEKILDDGKVDMPVTANTAFLYTRLGSGSCDYSKFAAAGPSTAAKVPYYTPQGATFPNCGTLIARDDWNYFYEQVSGTFIRLAK